MNLGFEWLVCIFDFIIQEKSQNKIRLLICDDHDNHISAKFVTHYIENNIYLFLLLSHSSYLLQSLDIDVFNLLKTIISANLDRLIRVGINRLEKME